MTPDRSLMARSTGLLLCALGLFVLLGWALGNHAMVRLIPGSVAMSINTALMFLVSGICLLLSSGRQAGGVAFRSGAWFIIALSGAILVEHIFNVDLPIDLATIHDALGDGHAKPGRSAPNTCAGFLLAGLALTISALPRHSRAVGRVLSVLAMLTLAIGLAGFVGYILRLDVMYQIATFNRMATFTALGMITLGTGLWTLPRVLPAAGEHPFGNDPARITTLAAALLMVFAIATGILSLAVLRESFEKAAADHHLITARSAAFTVSSVLEQGSALSSSIAQRPALRQPLAQLAAYPADRAALAALASAAQVFGETGFRGARIDGANGRTLAATGSLPEKAPSLYVAFGTTEDLFRLGWKNGFFLRNEHRVSHQGRHIATIVTEQGLAALDAFLNDARLASASTDILLCARGNEQAHCFPSRHYATGVVVPMFDRTGRPAYPISRALLGQTGSASAQDPRGMAVLAGYASISRQHMGIVVVTNARQLYMPLRSKLHILVLSVLMFVALGVLLLRRWLQPLVALIVAERQRIKAILDNANDAFIAIGPDGRVTDWNKQAEKTLGLAASSALGNDLAELIIPPEQRAGHNAGFTRFLASGTGPVINSRIEVTALHADGHRIPVELSVTAVQMGKQFGASAFLRDLSERKAAEASAAEHASALEKARQALTQSQKLEAVGKLTGGVAHDFNNVLQVVKGSLELLRQEHKDTADIMRRVDTAAGAVERGAKLAAQLLAFARKQPLQPKATSLARVVLRMEDMLQRALGDAIAMQLVISDSLWNTLVDPNQLEHVILNLAINARDAMDGAGTLSIRIENAGARAKGGQLETELGCGQFVMLAMSDTGSGMTQGTIQRAFEPFYSTKPEGHGTGLGLSMTYGFVKQSGGHIRLESVVGEGTTVRIYLPRSLEIEHHDVQAAPGAIEGGIETVLLVEDDKAVQATVFDLLSGLGYKVLTADHAANALGIIESGVPIDLLFTDVVMPGQLRSPELAKRARQLLPGIKVLFTSGYTKDAMVHGGRLDAGVELLSKPYGREQLARKIRTLLKPGDAPVNFPAKGEAALAPGALHIAFVEDNEDFRMIGSELISMIGHEVETFASAEEALKRMQDANFDVLLTDIGLPGMSGIDLAHAVYTASPATRIILASGYGDALSQRPSFPYQVLAKPFTLEQLEQRLA